MKQIHINCTLVGGVNHVKVFELVRKTFKSIKKREKNGIKINCTLVAGALIVQKFLS